MNKKYSPSQSLGDKGQKFFEFLVVRHCLCHNIVGSKDIGLDYICEWAHGEDPTGILFGVQVKTFSEGRADIRHFGTEIELNGLEKYKISYISDLSINGDTLAYWKRLGIPIYLFAIADGREMTCYYKRFTRVLTEGARQRDEFYYKVNRGNQFMAFKYPHSREQGFVRDLYIDYTRCNYYKGLITYLNPRSIGLDQFPAREDVVFTELFKRYKDVIFDTYYKTKKYIDLYLSEGKQ